MYRTYNARPIPRPYNEQNPRKKVFLAAAIVGLIFVYLGYALLRPMPLLKTTIIPPVVPAQVQVGLPWPATGQAAFGADSYGLLASHGEQQPRPIASVTKVMTALALLDKKPLQPGESGPPILLGERDVALYNEYVAKDGAVVSVSVGQVISEYQALQAILLPSANNIADSAVLWAFGSMDAYLLHANDMAKKLGMEQTKISDASGFSPATVSTARDLIRLGDAALDNPVIAEIVNQKEASFPDNRNISNVNNLLGQVNIRGIKTGNTPEAGGCYLAAADIYLGNQKITVITAIIGSTTRSQAMKDSVPIIQSAASVFQKVHIVRIGEHVGTITSPWGSSSELVAEKDLYVVSWSGTALAPKAATEFLRSPAPKGTAAGKFSLDHAGKLQEVNLRTADAITEAPVWWRLTHPL